MREVVLDTETTGLDPQNGDRVVEIGCIELVNLIPTGREWHAHVNPEREVPREAFEVHGLSTEFLSTKPVFATLADDFLDFVADTPIIAHNAAFDIAFLNAELARVDRQALAMDRVVDTLSLARRKHPGSPNSLDALCRRYQIDASARTKHGALIDCELLARVYCELTGRRQALLELGAEPERDGDVAQRTRAAVRPIPLPPRLTDAEQDAHAAFVALLGPAALWNRYTAE